MTNDAAFQTQAEYLRAREAMLGLRGLDGLAAMALLDALYHAMGRTDDDAFASMHALTRQAEEVLASR
jgi:hypothetical protein